MQLIQKQRGKNGISGIIITLPAAEIIKQNNLHTYKTMLRDIFQRVHTLQSFFPEPIPCHLLITKCDLLPGFKEFFSESTKDEITQPWGVTLPKLNTNNNLADIFTTRFNALIKKINQQLLWRLHHERNPMARPYIKDFPLQVERVKEFTIDFIKKLTATKLHLVLESVHLTSAIQTLPEPENETIDQSINSTAREIQLFREPNSGSRSYFIKQFLQLGLDLTQNNHVPVLQTNKIKRRLAYAASGAAIVISAVYLGNDFQQGIKQTYAIQKDLTDFQLRVAKMQDPLDHLLETLTLLNTLQQSVKSSEFKLDLTHILSYYSNKSQQKAGEVYQQALRTILIPEVKNYFEDYLKNPVNKDADDVYAVLKAYIMIGDATYLDSNHISNTLWKVLPKSIMESESTDLINHLNAALHSSWQPANLNENTVKETRRYLASLPKIKLSYILLKNIDNNNTLSQINMGANDDQTPVFSTKQISNQIPSMFTAKAFQSILNQETLLAAQEAVSGNWVLGHDNGFNNSPSLATPLVQQLRTIYIDNYIDVWESLLANINLTSPTNLAQTDALIISLISNTSPLMQLLKTIHENTYFEPITSASIRLQSLGQLVDKDTQSQKQLYEIFASLQSLHLYIQPALSADNQKRAAFDMITSRMLGRGTPDAITQLRIIADKNPEPVKNWLTAIANASSTYLVQEASRYLDTSWQNQVVQFYQSDIANRYPFGSPESPDVDIAKFTRFFGNPGIVLTFYNNYLQQFIDTSKPEWHWKKMDNQAISFSDDTLRQIQHAVRIHRVFFPNGDNKINLKFTLQPYEFGKLVKKVRLSINDKQFVDDQNDLSNTHSIAWPSQNGYDMTSVQLTLNNNQIKSKQYPGNWGWFKLVNQSFESVISKKELLLNISMNENPAKYLLLTQAKYNPFSSLNLRHFRLPQQLTDNKAAFGGTHA